MKKLNLLFTALLLMCYVGTAKAVEVTIDGIKYDVITKAKQATVISGGTKYSGDIVIASEITYNNVTYSVKSIGEKAFYQCSGLTSITIPNSVTSIGEKAFYQCSGLTSITIPNSVTSIGNQAFFYCSGLKEVHINDLVAWCNIDFGSSDANPLYIAHNLYLNNELITELVIPNGVTSIKNNAFAYCSGLTSVTIGNSVTSIGEDAFCGCYGLKSITIPNSVTSIGEGAFGECFGLKSITIPNSVTSIEDGVFGYCLGLTSITIPNSVTSIESYAFNGCYNLTSVTIGNSVTSIGYMAFYNCYGLTSLTIPNSVTSIGNQAFSGCENLTDVYCLATNVPETRNQWGDYYNPFEGSYPEYMTLHVPAEAINSYKTTEPWSSFGNVVAIIIEKPKCAAPVIEYYNGELIIECQTENAEFATTITNDYTGNYNSNAIALTEHTISAYMQLQQGMITPIP